MHNEHTRTPADLPANPAADFSVPADRRAMLAGIGGLAAGALLLSTRSAQAGPLTPPAGPVAPTGKTTQELFDKVAASEPRIAINATNTPGTATSLFKIGAPGSYYLTGNIQGVSGKHGIEIAGGGVSLDLNGFDMVGAPGSLDGIRLTLSGQTNLTVRNGSLRLWRGCGIDLSASAGNVSIHDINADSNTLDGIRVSDGASVVRCTASYNGAGGLRMSNGGQAEGCIASWNGTEGIRTGDGCTVSNCSAFQNASDGLRVEIGCTVSNCSASNNTGNGINTAYGCTVSNCAAFGNANNGILCFGFFGNGGCTVAHCTVYSNTGSGIDVNFGSTVNDCTVRHNILDGIRCGSQCTIRGNTCTNNYTGGTNAGIHAIGNDNRIEGNSCTGAARGIDVDLAGNIIIRNTCSGNTTNWDVVAGNVCLVVQGVTGAAILGNTGGVAPGSTDPNANFSY
jgi:parallel beta-helix repeat protein